jgi:hypothetical protein
MASGQKEKVAKTACGPKGKLMKWHSAKRKIILPKGSFSFL